MFAGNTPEGIRQRGQEAYRREMHHGRLGLLQSALTGRGRRLRELAGGARRRAHYLGVQLVPLSQIRGSEGRCGDFDLEFHPLNGNTRDRWLSIYGAWERGAALPLVQLVRVGEIYYVRDGHHRLSVAHAMGQEVVEAEVTVWE